ncbi:T9SS type A sorting domain-containing protein [Lewinella sp. JB7]|uniref:T9SS type A sorting domain-containing protein n=1 Tax=Lewinella sp. JB7 TaxID=2962887 RepID=UPI0020C9AA66|nr:T9SS type A sorting domain-containing protein [Lewinella sp. JB7]MCP9236480.1 T9SS type A sorting domain-containing protein [Lewinella sp. JB7]
MNKYSFPALSGTARPCVALILLCSLLSLPLTATTSTCDPVTYVQDNSTGDGLVVLEAERTTSRSWSTVGTQNVAEVSWKEFTSNTASNGAYIKVPAGGQTANGTPPKGARLDFEIEFVKTGIHYLNLRYLAPNTSSNSVYVAFDGVVFQNTWNMAAGSADWAWLRAPSSFHVPSTGTHTITIYHREAGLLLDKAVVTSVSDMELTDFGPDVTEAGTTTAKSADERIGYRQDNRSEQGLIILEVEMPTHAVAGTDNFACREWEEIADPTASGGSYMNTTNANQRSTTSNMWTAPRLDFEIEVTEIDTHYIHIRHRGTTNNNSVWVSVNHYFVEDWHISQQTTDWTWESPNYGYLTSTTGTYLLSIIMREDGTPIDKIIITTDKNYQPSETKELTTEVSPPDRVYTQTGTYGVVELPVEKPSRNLAGIGQYDTLRWQNQTDVSALGGSYAIVPNVSTGGVLANNEKSADAPLLEYVIDFAQTGTHYLSMRHRAPTGSDNSYTIYLDGVKLEEKHINPLSPDDWVYQDDLPTFDITTTGLHTLTIAMREDGTPLDNMVISSSPAFNARTMPIDLISFTAWAESDHNRLEWSSSYEDNTFAHLVQRSESGHDGWTTIGRVAAAGSSRERVDYYFEDRQAPALAYYRIVTVDLDDSESISSLISVVREFTRVVTASFSVYPNPASDYATLRYDHPTGGTVDLRITSLSGQTVATKRITALAGTNEEHIPLDRLPAGTYVLTGSLGSSGTIVERIVVNH